MASSLRHPPVPREDIRAAERPSPVTSAIGVSRGGGRTLPTWFQRELEATTGQRFDDVRIHQGATVDQAVRSLGALAFTVGTDVFFGSGNYAPDDPRGRRLLAHELAHVLVPRSASTTHDPGVGAPDAAEETAAEEQAGRLAPRTEQPAIGPTPRRVSHPSELSVVRRYANPTQTAYTATIAGALSNTDLLAAIGDLRGAFRTAGPEAATTPGLWANLDLMLDQVRQRHLSVGDNDQPGLATKPGDLAAPGQTAALDAHYEALDAQAQRQLGRQAAPLRARIAQRRTWLAALHRDAVQAEGAKVEALQVAMIDWQQSKRILPARPTGDARIAGYEQNLRQALAFAAETLLGTGQQDGVVALELARTDYLSAFARLLLLTADDLKTQLRNPRLRDIPMVSYYEEGINTRTPGGPWEGGDDLREYRASLARLTAALDADGDLAARARAGPVERLRYLIEHGDHLMDQVGQVQALMIAGQGIGLVSFFQDATSSQLQTFDWARINDMRNEIIKPMIDALRSERAPDSAVIEKAQFHLELASPEPTDKQGNPDPVAIAEQRRRHRERRQAKGLGGDEPEDLTRRRLREIAKFNHDFGIFAGVVASVIIAVAAAGAVGAVMRTAVFSEGGALAAGQGIRVGLIRFAVQSLTFTLASQTITAALYGKLPAPSDVAKAAAMDALTLGFMHGIGLPYTRLGQQPPTALQFGALWAWSSAWQVGGLAWRGQLTLGSGMRAVALSGVETALMLKAMEVAHQIGLLPTPDGLGNWFRPRTPEQAAALREYLAAQRLGRAVREDAVAWERSERQAEALDAILERSQGFMGQYRRALDAMRTSGMLSQAEINPILDQAVAQATGIRTLRDAMRLGMQPAGPDLVSYTGTVENLLVYLQRLRQQGSVTAVNAVGRSGVLEVTYADGSVRHFYPRGTGTPPLAADLLLESVQRSLPDSQPARHLQVLESLRRLPRDVAARLSAAAETSAHGRTVLEFIARPEVSIELSRPGSLYGEQLLSDALAGNAEAIGLLARPERPIDLQRWYQTEFERINPAGTRDLGSFVKFLEDVRLYRGTLEVSTLGQAREVTRAITGAATAELFPVMPTTTGPTPPSISMPGPRVTAPTPPRRTAYDYFRGQGFSDILRRFDAFGLEWYLTLDANGRPQHSWAFRPGTDQPVLQTDVAGALARLRAGVAQLDTLGNAPDARTRPLVDQLTAQARALFFLRRMRGFDIAAELRLMDRVELDPRGSSPRATPPPVDLPGLLAPPTTGPGALLDPVTPSEVLSQRQRGLEARAGRMGRLGDGSVQAGMAAQIRTPMTLNEQAAARTLLETAERHLDQVAEAAYDETSRRLGPNRFATVVAHVFPRRTRIQIGEALRFMSEQPGFTDATLESLARLPAGQRAVLGRLEPALLTALGEIAATSPEAASALLEQQGARLVELQQNPGMAARFIRVAHLLRGGQLPFADPHRHLFGGILYPELLVQAMGDAAVMALSPGVTNPQSIINTRLEALRIARTRLVRAGDTVATELPPGHPGTEAYLASWQAARPLVERYGELLEDSIRRSVCRVDQAALEQQLDTALTRAFTLPAETAARGPQGDIFFTLFGALSRAAPPRGRVVPAAVSLAAGQRVAYVELRGGLSGDVRKQLAAQGMTRPDGTPLPDVRIVISVPRGQFRPPELEAELAGLGPLRSRVVGIDLSGVESVPLPAAGLLAANGSIAATNFRALESMFTANPALHTEVTTRLGLDPVATGRTLAGEIAAGRAPAGGAPQPVAELARLNRRVQEVVSELDARDNASRLPDTLLGTTIHAGEQVRSDARIDMLLDDMQRALHSGVDRIGHGIVLGYPLPHGLAELGFTRQANGDWSRPGPGGQAETYTPARLQAMERQRLDLIRRIGDEDVTLEISPTSNLVISGMSPTSHPLAQLLRTRPNLRVAVSTDNPALHLTDPARELAIATAVSGASHPQMVRIYLEGFSSRLGARRIGNAATVREQVREALVAATPPVERPYVLLELQTRYGTPASGVTASTPIDEATFGDRLVPYLERTIR